MTRRIAASATSLQSGSACPDRLTGISEDELDRARQRADRALAHLDRSIPADVEPAHIFIPHHPAASVGKQG